MMGREYFCGYHSYLDAISVLNEDEIGRLFIALLTYSKTWQEIELAGNEFYVFPAMKAQIDRDKKKYLDTCRKNKENAEKRYKENGKE